MSFTENSGKTLWNFEFLGKFSLSFRKILSFIPLSFGEIVQKKPGVHSIRRGGQGGGIPPLEKIPYLVKLQPRPPQKLHLM